jgi:hypothetical protein
MMVVIDEIPAYFLCGLRDVQKNVTTASWDSRGKYLS